MDRLQRIRTQPGMISGGGSAAFLAMVAMSAIFASPASAGPIFTVNVSPGPGRLSDSEPVSASGTAGNPPGTFSLYGGPDNYWAVEASARSDHGLLATSAYGIAYFPQPMTYAGLFGGTPTAIASFTIDDLVITGPGTTVSGSLRLQLDGGFGALTGGGPNVTATGSVQVNVRANAPHFLTVASGLARSVAHDEVEPLTTSGLLTGYSGGLTLIEVPFADAPVGVPITLSLDLISGASGSVNLEGAFFGSTGYAEGFSNYSDALSFATSGDVFVLPPGYSADSPDGGIVDNRFPGADPPTSAVPEPSTWALLATGMIAFPYLRRTGRCCHASRNRRSVSALLRPRPGNSAARILSSAIHASVRASRSMGDSRGWSARGWRPPGG